MFVFPTKLIPKSDTAHSGLKAGLSLFYRPFAIFVLPSSYSQYNCSYLFKEKKTTRSVLKTSWSQCYEHFFTNQFKCRLILGNLYVVKVVFKLYDGKLENVHVECLNVKTSPEVVFHLSRLQCWLSKVEKPFSLGLKSKSI